jgi:hypothetical protein
MRVRFIRNAVWLLAGFAAPLSILRISGLNLTFFDLVIVGAGVLILLRILPFRVPVFIVAVGGCMAVGLLATIFRAPNTLAAVQNTLQWLFILYILIPVVYSGFRSERAFLYVSIGMFLAMVGIALYGVYEVQYMPKPYLRYRYRSIFDSPQVAGFQISVMIPFLLFLLRRARHARYRLITGGFVLAVFASLLWFLPHTLSRTAAISAAVGVVVFLSLVRARRPQLLLKGVMWASLIGILVVGGFVIYVRTAASAQVVVRVEQTMSWNSPEVSDRTKGWKDALQIDPSYYLVGMGLDNYQNVSSFAQKPHNVFLLLLTEGGILVVLMFTVMLTYFFLRAVQALRLQSDGLAREFLVATVASMCSYLVIAMLNTQVIQRFYWFVFALGLAAVANIGSQLKNPVPSSSRMVVDGGGAL